MACVTAPFGRTPVPHAAALDWTRDEKEIITYGLATQALAITGADRRSGPEPTPCSPRLVSAAHEEAFRSLRVVATAAPILADLTACGIPFTLLKGPAAARHYDRPQTRTFRDIDVLVGRADFTKSREVIARYGLRCPGAAEAAWPWFDLLCREGVNYHGDRGENVDLHHHVPPWALGIGLVADQIHERSTGGIVGGVPVRMASLEDSFAIAALHVMSDLWKRSRSLQSWRDMVQFLAKLGPANSSRALSDRSLSWMEPVITEMLQGITTRGLAPASLDPPLAVSTRVRLKAMGWFGGANVQTHQLGWAFRLPVANAMAYLAGSAVPAKRFVQDRSGSYRAYWRQGARSALRR